MRRAIVTLLAISLVSGVAYAVDPGRAQGAVVIDGNRIDLNYAYAVGNQKNEVTNRRDDTRVVVTDKPLPDGTKLEDIDYSFPDGTFGMVVCITHDDKVSHIVVQHAKGMYDGGYFDGEPSYSFKRQKNDRGAMTGNVSSRKVKTNTMTFSFDVDFDVAAK
ncbi:MAG: hypothetical protein DMF58_01260 [Acidobacteria bacterium]|nr:MAG: hypothetical protein DMF58_01260 [Acidobacteriota bacterium]